MALRTNSAEGGSNGATVSTSNTGGASGNAFDSVTLSSGGAATFDSTNKYRGSMSYRFLVPSTAGATAFVEYSGASSTSTALRFYVKIVGDTVGGNIEFVSMTGASAGVSIWLNIGGRMDLRDVSGNLIASGTRTVMVEHWFRVEIAVTAATSTTGSVTCSFYYDDSTTPFETLASGSSYNLGTGTFTTLRIGKISSAAADMEVAVDNIAFNDSAATLIGPSATGSNILQRSQGSVAVTTSSTLTLSAPGTIQAGDYLIAFIHDQSSVATVDISSSGWTRIGPAFVASSVTQRITAMYAKVATGSEPGSYSFTLPTSGSRVVGFISAFSGVDIANPIAATSSMYAESSSSQFIWVGPETSFGNKYTLELWAANFSSPDSYAHQSIDHGFEMLGQGYNPAGAENTGVSRSAIRVWSGVAPGDGTHIHYITTTGQSSQRAVSMVALNEAGGGSPPPEETLTPSIIGHTTATSSGATGTITVNPATNLVNGPVATDDWIILIMTSPGNISTTKAPTAPAGWTNLVPFTAAGIGNITFGVWAHKRAGGETTYTWTQTTAESQNTYHRLIFIRDADDVANWVTGAFNNRATNGTSTTNVAASITTTVDHTLGLAISAERTTAVETDAQVTCNNFTKDWFENNQDHSLFVAYKEITPPGATGSVTVTYPNAQTNNGIAGLLGIPGIEAPPAGETGLAIKVSNGTGLVEAWFQLADGAGGFVTPGAYKVLRPGYSSVTQMLAQTTFYCAHRGGSRDYPEMSMYAYGQSALLGYPALEISLARTSDGVWFGLHDSTLDRTSGVTGVTASSLTWAQVQTYNILGSMAANNTGQPNRPYMRWEELIALYYPSHVIFVDPKVALGFHTELITMMNALPGTPTDHFVAKYFGEGNSGGWPANARTAGYKTWGYYYAGGAWATWQHLFDILGMDYSAPGGDWTSILSHGKPVMGHIAPDAAAVTTALSKGAAGVMVSGVKVSIPPAIT